MGEMRLLLRGGVGTGFQERDAKLYYVIGIQRVTSAESVSLVKHCQAGPVGGPLGKVTTCERGRTCNLRRRVVDRLHCFLLFVLPLLPWPSIAIWDLSGDARKGREIAGYPVARYR